MLAQKACTLYIYEKLFGQQHVEKLTYLVIILAQETYSSYSKML